MKILNVNFVITVALLFVLSACSSQINIGGYENYLQDKDKNVFCQMKDTEFKMSLYDAKLIALKSDCSTEGILQDNYGCNEYTGTWWIDLETNATSCNPACVINVETDKSEINWRCTGALPDVYAPKNNEIFEIIYDEDKKVLHYSGTVAKPNPCSSLKFDELIMESYPTQIQINIEIVNSGEICAQVITEEKINREIKLSEKPSSVSIQFNDEKIYSTDII